MRDGGVLECDLFLIFWLFEFSPGFHECVDRRFAVYSNSVYGFENNLC